MSMDLVASFPHISKKEQDPKVLGATWDDLSHSLAIIKREIHP
jgi:hypothetical protein